MGLNKAHRNFLCGAHHYVGKTASKDTSHLLLCKATWALTKPIKNFMWSPHCVGKATSKALSLLFFLKKKNLIFFKKKSIQQPTSPPPIFCPLPPTIPPLGPLFQWSKTGQGHTLHLRVHPIDTLSPAMGVAWGDGGDVNTYLSSVAMYAWADAAWKAIGNV